MLPEKEGSGHILGTFSLLSSGWPTPSQAPVGGSKQLWPPFVSVLVMGPDLFDEQVKGSPLNAP